MKERAPDIEAPVHIWVVGSTMIDMITYAPRIPDAGQTIVGDAFSLGFGGKGANQAVMAKRLGARVSVINCLGSDVFGDMTIENFLSEGIDTSHVTRTAEVSSGVAPIWVEPNGENRIICVPGANFKIGPEEAAGVIERAEQVDLVLGQLEMLQQTTAAAFQAGHARGAHSVLNPAPSAELIPELLEATDWLVPNEFEFADITSGLLRRSVDPFKPRDVSDAVLRLGVRIAVTLGERGAALCDRHGEVHYVAPPVVTAHDTTGAGDAFVGAFAYGLANGQSEMESLRLGCACAAVSVTRSGTQKSFPRGAELNDARAWAQQPESFEF
jgi:ribokinase